MKRYLYTIREAAEMTATSKSTVRRYLSRLPPEEIGQEIRAGHPVILLSEAAMDALRESMRAPSTDHGAHQSAHQVAPDAPESGPRTDELVTELRARIAAQDREIAVKNDQIASLTAALETAQKATAAAQALHAATAEQLRRLTAAQEAPESRQDESQPEQTTDTTPSKESNDEATSGATVAPETVTAKRATFGERLRFLFSGR